MQGFALAGALPVYASGEASVRAAWAGLPQPEHATPYEYGGELGRNLPDQRQAVDRIVGAYVAERYSPDQQAGSDSALEQDFLALRGPLLGRMLSRIGASARPGTRK